MNILKWSNKKWLKIYSYELLFCILSLALLILFFHGWASKTGARGVALTVILLIGGTNLYCLRSSRPNQIVHGISKWLNIVIVPTYLCSCWVLLGNLLLKTLPQVEILTVILLWLIYVVLLLPLAMSWAATVKNWFLRLLAITFIGIQYGPDARLNVDRHLTLMHAITSQGVIAALSLFVLACFLGYAWGFRFNPNLKFRKGPNFQQSVFVILLLFTLIDLLYNCFNAYNQDLWSALFRYDIGSLKFSWPNLTAALEPGILEETERYLNIIILLAGFNRFPKWRVPIAVYGSALLFGLPHLSNLGIYGETLPATLAQAIGVTGDGFLWAVLYLYSGKIWPSMLAHFMIDFIADLQVGWNEPGWDWHGYGSDYLYTIIIVGVPLIFSLWMMYGRRRQVMEENVDRMMRGSQLWAPLTSGNLT